MIKSVSDPPIASILSTSALKVYTIPRHQLKYTWGGNVTGQAFITTCEYGQLNEGTDWERTKKLIELALQVSTFDDIKF